MFQRKYSLKLLAITVAFLSSLLISLFIPENALAQNPYDELATQAVRNNYGLYQSGQAVDGKWGNFSSYDAYILNLAGAAVGTWVYDGTSFKASIISLINVTIANEGTANKSSSKRVAQDYLAAKSLGENAKAVQLLDILQTRQTVVGNGSFDNDAFSDIAAFEMLGRAGDIDKIATAGTISFILAQQNASSGAWTGTWPDVMATAEAVRALKYIEPYAGEQGAAVTSAIISGCTWLQARQQASGGFCDASGSDDTVVDTSEIIYTLKVLNIVDPATWSKGGKSAIDYLQNEALNPDKTFGTSNNIASNTWVLDAYRNLGAKIDTNTVLRLNIEPTSATIAVNGTQQLTAEVYELGGSLTDVTSTASWSVDDSTVASVSNGLVQGLKVGQTNINVAFNGVVKLASITVTLASSGGLPGPDLSNTISAYIAVLGKSNYLLYSPGTVDISKNSKGKWTAMDALQATGLSTRLSATLDGFLVEIAGEANQGMSGWMYSINGRNPSDVPQNTSVANGDKIIFWYSMSTMSNSPTWPDILDLSTSKLDNVKTLENKDINTTLNSYSTELASLLNTGSNVLKIVNLDKKMNLEAIKVLKKELDSNEVNLSQEVGKAEAVLGDTEISMLIPENALSQTVNLSVKELRFQENPEQANVKLGSSTYEFGPSGTKFDKPITIGIKVAITEDMNIESLSPAWYDELSKQWIPIPGVIDLNSGLVVFRIDHFTKFALIELPQVIKVNNRITFADVNKDIAWAKDAIEILAGQGIIKGTGTQFEPQRSISRAEFIQLVITSLELETVEYSSGLFSDVEASKWFASSVASAHKNKIISEYPDGTFRPNDSISRNEVASIFNHLEAIKNSVTDVNLVFKDVDKIPAWASNGVKYVYKQGLMKGYEDGTFKGNNPLSRAEAAVVIYKYLQSISKI